MDEARSISKMTPLQGAELSERAAGSPAAARRLVFYSAWRRILATPKIPRAKRLPTLRALIKNIEVLVEA